MKNLGFFLKLLISASILTALFLRADEHALADMARHFHASAWLYAILFIAGQSLLLALRWQYLLNLGKRHITYLQSVQVNLVSQLANLVFITSVGGVVARVALSMQYGASFFKSLIATVFDRLMTLSALLVFAALFLPGLSDVVDGRTYGALAWYIGIFIITLFVFAPLFLNAVFFRLPAVRGLKGKMRYGVRYLKILTNHPLLLIKFIAVSLIAQLGLFAALYALSVASGVELSFWQMMTILPVIAFVSALPISIGGWGVREGAFVYGLGLFGVPMETAFLISVQAGLISMLTTILLGLPSLMTFRFEGETLTSFRAGLARIRRR